ncbi:MAG: glycosyltransferase family 4 protein [Melioribacteraceae bacterium]|nr:glycosyltransferase family 4 protein [Melioribacteraceae bacterium]MCF8264203.1 glycosyltransferase family 4 protein [Melioribacteraceae bacterium]MCF8412173.1 glycosyltransferase family 4 protein [Melioribacteraceae bacterium]MCF8431723.1 glycosyltransferase family 4 protein [Melioribacteraceae bacterium]
MKLLFLLHFFKPESCAAAIRLNYFVDQVRNSGIDYEILAPKPNYPHGRVFPGFEGGIIHDKENYVTYLPIYLPQKPSVIGRFLSYFSYSLTALFYTLYKSKNFDVIISSSPPIFTAFTAAFLSKFKKKKFILDLRDIWPDIGIELGILNNKDIIYWLKRMEKFIYNRADRIIVTADGDRKNLVEKGVQESKIELIFNGVDTAKFRPLSEEEKKLIRKDYKLPIDKKIAIYFGSLNQGMNDIELLIDVILNSANKSEEIFYVVVGDGENKTEVLSKIGHLSNNLIIENLNHTELSRLVASSDISLVPRKDIRKDTGGNIPVKLFESLAAGVPVVLSTISGTEIEKIFTEIGVGRIVKSGDPEAFREAVESLITDTESSNIGIKAGEYVKINFDRINESKKFLNIIRDLKID